MGEQRAYPGFLIAFEGLEEERRLEALAQAAAALHARDHEVVVTRPMGPTLAGKVYRDAARFNELSPRTLLLVAASDLAERLEWDILPALQAGKVVLADRYVYRIVQGLARDLDPAWLEILSAFAPRPDLVLFYPGQPTELASKLDLDTLDLYEAGMDLGLTRDVPLSYQLYQERILKAYAQWARAHDVELVRPRSMAELLQRIERDLGLEVGDVDVRLRGVIGLMRASVDLPHSLKVVELGQQLFDQLRPLHNLGPDAAELLVLAALLHNLGREAGGEHDHHIRTAALIDASHLEGFGKGELRVVAALAAAHTVRHNRELEAWLETLPARYRETVRKLAPIARLADAMDASHKQTVRWVEAILHDKHQLLVRMQSRTRARAEVKVAREAARLMEVVYGLEVDVIAERQGPPPACADLRPTMMEQPSDGLPRGRN